MVDKKSPPFETEHGSDGLPQYIIPGTRSSDHTSGRLHGGASKRSVSAVIGMAEQKAKLAVERGARDFPRLGQAWGGVDPGDWRGAGDLDETGCLPSNCPVRPLGYENENYFFEDTSGQIFNSGDKAMSVERVQKLFAGCEEFVCWAWPGFGPKGKGVTGFKAEHARRDLFAACRQKGPWSMTEKVRGRGAWRDDEGHLILHCGDYLWVNGSLHETGELGGYFYVRRPATFSPWEQPVDAGDNPAVEIFKAFSTWNMKRGRTDALLLLGSLGVSMLGASIDWRPSTFIIGDAGTGKSELTGASGLIRAIMGKAMIATTNATEAELYQTAGHDCLAISIDELEGDDNPAQAKKIIKMSRDAASGSIRIRGGADHKGVEFQARSPFYFSGINPPGLNPATLSRLAVLQLLPLAADKVEPPTLHAIETVGPRLLRCVVDGYGVYEDRLRDYMAVLREGGHNARGQRTFGTFLAAAHTLLGDEGLHELGFPAGLDTDDALDYWSTELAADALPELETSGQNFQECIEWLMNARPEVFRGGARSSVAEILRDKEISFDVKKNLLFQADLGLLEWDEFSKRVMQKDASGHWMAELKRGVVLAVPNKGQQLARVFDGSRYAGSWHWALSSSPDGIVI
ncbi:MAG: hypothetical protein JKY98_05320, partial [Gammaproteobacteria bacterium]|nr:hypothetical protein [Gammaproteobacteria bacterium]